MILHYYLQVAVDIEIPDDELPIDPGKRDDAIEAKDGEYQTALYNSLDLSSNIDNGTLKVSSVELSHHD